MHADDLKSVPAASLLKWLKRISGVATSGDLAHIEVRSFQRATDINHGLEMLAQRSAEINHGLVMLAQRVTTLEERAQEALHGLTLQIDEARSRLDWLINETMVRTDGLFAAKAETYEWLAGLDRRVEEASTNIRCLVPAAEKVTDAAGNIGQFSDPEFGRVEGFRGSSVVHDDGTGLYAGFEDWFRGSEQTIADRQHAYLRVLRDHSPVLDVGCGRGELLELLKADGVDARGVDIDPAMVTRCRAKGLDVSAADAVEALEQSDPGSLGTVFAAQVIEHLPYRQLIRFLAAARRALGDHGLLIAETVNPHSPQGLKLFWVDPTHQHPLYPETMLALCHFSGYQQAFCWYPQGRGDPEADRVGQRDYAIIARPH